MGENNHGIEIRKRILDAVVKYIEEHGYPPTIREIGSAVGLQSTSSVQSHLNKMIIDGTLETDADGMGLSRALRVPGYRFVKEDTLRMEELYSTNQRFKSYVDKYCTHYGLSRQQAFEVALVREMEKCCMEETEYV